MKAVIVKNLNKEYNIKSKKILALKNINVEFDYGKFYLIKGHSGSGKSTLLHIIGLIDNKTSGNLYINEKDVSQMKEQEKSYVRNTKIGYIFQEFFLDKYLTAQENVTVPMLINKKFKTTKEINTRSKNLLIEMGLNDRIKHFPKELSGGEQQRVCIARALANDPDIILADEPTGNLDIENEEFIFKKLKEMSTKGKCIIMVSHSEYALKYADKVIEIKEGVLKC